MSAGPNEEARLKGRAVPSRAALRTHTTHTEWSKAKSAPRDHSECRRREYPADEALRAAVAGARDDSTADCGLSQLPVAPRRQPQRGYQ